MDQINQVNIAVRPETPIDVLFKSFHDGTSSATKYIRNERNKINNN